MCPMWARCEGRKNLVMVGVHYDPDVRVRALV